MVKNQYHHLLDYRKSAAPLFIRAFRLKPSGKLDEPEKPSYMHDQEYEALKGIYFLTLKKLNLLKNVQKFMKLTSILTLQWKLTFQPQIRNKLRII